MKSLTLADAAEAVRAAVEAAAAGLPPYPEGITFRVSPRAAGARAIDVEVLGVPRSWLYDTRPGAADRPSAAWRALSDALTQIAARHFKADGKASFIDVSAELDTKRGD